MNSNYEAFINILKEELIPAMGCTEPIAVAYCAASARRVLGLEPDQVQITASGNIIKNVKSVIVPNTGACKGLETAAAIGIVAGNPDKKLQVIADVTDEQKAKMCEFLAHVPISVDISTSGLIFDILVTLYKGSNSACCRIANNHTNIVLLEKNGQVLFSKPIEEDADSGLSDRSFLSLEAIYDFAETVEINDVKSLLDHQIQYNMSIAEEGMHKPYGANIGATLLKTSGFTYGSHTPGAEKIMAKAMAAAGSDARMNGCEMPVIINSGSGNQGITVSVPVVVYAKSVGASEEKTYRALVLSNLIAIYQKTYIGRLSAYCGAISAGCAAGCAIAYLQGADLDTIAHTLVNSVSISSGVICDGAKPSCAAKIALAVDTGIFGYEMYKNGYQFYQNDGIVRDSADAMVRSVGRLAREGMKETDEVILKIMTNK